MKTLKEQKGLQLLNDSQSILVISSVYENVKMVSDQLIGCSRKLFFMPSSEKNLLGWGTSSIINQTRTCKLDTSLYHEKDLGQISVSLAAQFSFALYKLKDECSFIFLRGWVNSTKDSKARDQKQIYRLKETMSHWGLNPPPLAE